MTVMILGPIIGGFIAGIIGLGTVLLQNYLSKKKEQSLIVNDLLVEIEANLKICCDPASAKMWWMVKFKTEAYNSYKGKIAFLPGEVRSTLSEVVHTVEGVNTAIEVQLWRSGGGIAEPHEFRPIEHPDYLKQWLTFCRDELRNWQKQHASKRKSRRFFNMKKDNRKNDRKVAGGLTLMSVAVALVCLGATSLKQPEWAPYVYICLGIACYFIGFLWLKQSGQSK